MAYNRKEIFTIPNILSIVRLILVPVFVSFYLNAASAQDYRIAGIIILFSGITDLVDGIIARKFNQITDIGKLLDPVADKVTQAAIVFCLMVRFQYMWIIVVLFLVKELSMLIWNIVLIKKNKKLDGALWYGKVSTAVFYACMTIMVAFPTISDAVANGLMAITGFFLFLSFILYTKIFVQMHQSGN
ncbi:CDP-alcohol phosphatidyltransferase family protein [Desemzia sp. RIT804]|uniref:CDP-alcohol phosphatidyltransferase family protein n=1 Tax=Desemzia sp. RIT 804 TaxID=2810209 RepID=UPI00194FA7BD|nr:CDP-alcohol phosphatidyltransferase family protein [Desemzia sp. RIT 804]MBM6613956.1 CDP-alcohol phosphatidyltransferase family protein [Desemzia sp. RIT 804]